MLKRVMFSRLLQTTGIAVSFTVATLLSMSQPSAYGQYYVAQRFPTGPSPLGFAVTKATFPDSSTGGLSLQYVAVANSGDDSVSVFQVTFNPSTGLFSLVSRGVAHVQAPYGVVACGQAFLVTSSSGNTITGLNSDGTISGTINVGPQPYSAVCQPQNNTVPPLVLVSTLGDNALTVNPGGGSMRIPNVPGSRALHGIDIDGNGNAWVAGTDANVVTVVNLGMGKVLASIPVRQPIAIAGSSPVYVASGIDNTVTVFNPNTLQIVSTFRIAANPRDCLGSICTSGDSVVDIVIGSQNQAIASFTIPDIPGAFALAPVTLLQSQQNSLMVTSRDSNTLVLLRPVPPPPSPAFGVSNGASFGTSQTALGSLASAFATTGVTQNFSVSSLPLPRVLGGVILSVGGTLNFSAASGWTYSSTGSIQAPLLFVGPSQVNFQIPPGITSGSAVPAQLTKPDGTTLLTTLNITATGPGIFSVLENGQGQGAVLNDDYSQNGNPQSIVGAKLATRGSFIQIYGTGAGDTTPTLMPGEAAPASGNPLVLTNVQPTVTIGGQSAQVLFSGMAPGFVGLWQINAQIPQTVTPGNAVPLVVSAGGVASNTVTIAVQ